MHAEPAPRHPRPLQTTRISNTPPVLALFLETADAVEQAATRLGAKSGALASLPAKCEAFRNQCRLIAANRGVDRVSVSFVGPRDAGKTTLLKAVLRNDALTASMPAGDNRAGRTCKLTWVGPERPENLAPEAEQWVRAEPFKELGTPVEFVDVPGFDDIRSDLREVAIYALSSSVVKVLVVDRKSIEAVRISNYMLDGDGSLVLPVVNLADAPDPEDIAAFKKNLQDSLKAATILDPVLVPDFEHKNAPTKDAVLGKARDEILAALSGALREKSRAADGLLQLAHPRLHAAHGKFRSEVARIAKDALPASAEALARLEEAERTLPGEILESFFADHRSLVTWVRARFRAILLDNTPVIFFPWRLILGGVVLVWGALDRALLVFLGSLPSAISTGRQAIRNVKDAWEFRKLEREGLRKTIQEEAAIQIRPRLDDLYASLDADLSGAEAGLRIPENPEVLVNGVESAQAVSTGIFRDVVEDAAPGPRFSLYSALLGTAVFWGIFIWPLVAIYRRFFDAVVLLLAGREADAMRIFPEGIGSMLATTAFLALLPMVLCLLACGAWIMRRPLAEQAVEDLKEKQTSCPFASGTNISPPAGRSPVSPPRGRPSLPGCKLQSPISTLDAQGDGLHEVRAAATPPRLASKFFIDACPARV